MKPPLHRFRLAPLAFVLVLSLGAASCSPRRGSGIRSAAGLASHTLCAAAFVQRVDPAQVYEEAVAPMPGFFLVRPLLHYDVDRERREVRVRIAGSFETRAVYRPGWGCLLVHAPEDAASTAAPRQPSDPAPHPDLTLAEPAEPRDSMLRAALEEAFAEPAGHPYRHVKAIVVVQDGKILAERYAPGIGVDTPLPGWSMSKSVTSALIGVLVRQGRLSVDQPAPVAAWQTAGDPRRAVTIDMLLRQTSGLALEETGSGFDPNSRMLFQERDMASFAERAPLDAVPGKEWRYMSGNAQILSRILRDAAGGDARGVLQFARRELFDPLGMRDATMEFDAAGTPVGSSYLFAPARDWARFGMLYLNDGVAGGRRILPEGWVRYSAAPTPQALPGYGAGWWTNLGTSRGARARVAMGMPADSFFASGALGQRIVVVPSERLVMVHLGLTQDWPDFDIQGAARLARQVVEAVRTAGKP